MPGISLFVLLQENQPKGFFNGQISFGVVLAVVGLMILLFSFYIWLQRKRFKQENKSLSDKLSERSYQVMMQKWELERKNMSISQQNRDIIESIQYARNIQTAMLPKQDLIARHFKDVFILYKPKDIVSGDFYFFELLDEKIFLAVGDCTGHGVAGAFMSMVGSSLLHQIVSQKRITDPSWILNELNSGMVEALQQKENSSHGGMDIALICIDRTKQEMQFAGANRPLYYIRSGQAEIVSHDKLPIGGFQQNENRQFTKHVLTMEQDDCYYMFSDGYADQFGGPEGKKIMTKKFKELLYSLHDQPMSEQKYALDTFFETWRGKFEQVDDVLVIGFKVS